MMVVSETHWMCTEGPVSDTADLFQLSCRLKCLVCLTCIYLSMLPRLWFLYSSVFSENCQWLSTQLSEFRFTISASSLAEWIAHMICRHPVLSWPLLEKQRSLQEAAEVFILLSTHTERLITALRGSWRNITVWSLEMTKLQQPLALWCSSKVRVNIFGFLLGDGEDCLTFPGLISSLHQKAVSCCREAGNPTAWLQINLLYL